MKSIFISGIGGNMGQRYASITGKLGIETYGAENNLSFMEQAVFCERSGVEGIIIASPTATHLDALSMFTMTGIPILCEKPIMKSYLKVGEDTAHLDLVTMVNQYAYLYDPDSIGPTKYNYFKTGSDSLAWDCINIIGLARGSVTLENTSPIWSCTINGFELSLSDMDQAYIDMVEDWVNDPTPNYEYQVKAHEKVKIYLESKNMRRPNGVEMDTQVISMLGRDDD